MERILYNVKIWEKKRRIAQFQVIGAIIAFLGLLVGSLGNYWFMNTFSHVPILTLGIVGLGIVLFFFLSLTSWTNYTFLYYYFYSQWIGQQSPQDLELVTGRIVHKDRVTMPYAGTFYYIHVKLHDGGEISLYIKPKLLKRIQQTEPIRLLNYHMFVYDLK